MTCTTDTHFVKSSKAHLSCHDHHDENAFHLIILLLPVVVVVSAAYFPFPPYSSFFSSVYIRMCVCFNRKIVFDDKDIEIGFKSHARILPKPTKTFCMLEFLGFFFLSVLFRIVYGFASSRDDYFPSIW